MAVSRKAMTEGIRTSIFPGILNSRTFTIPQSKIPANFRFLSNSARIALCSVL